MKQLVMINTSTKAVTVGASAWTPPPITFGETLTLAMRFKANVDGASIERSLDVRALRAAVGNIDARPNGGSVTVQIGAGDSTVDNTTAAVPWNVSATALQSAINAVAPVVATYGQAKVELVDDSFLIRFGTELVSVPIQVRDNTLYPSSFGSVSGWQVDGKWVQELRFMQAPVAFTDAHARVLPPQPSIARLQAGGSDAGSGVYWNEIQTLSVPPEFIGTYQLRKGYAKTILLSGSDGADAIQSAMASLGDGFSITNPLPNQANIEFINGFKGEAQDLLVIQIGNAPEGDLTLNLPFGMESLARLLRSQASVTLPFDVVVDVADADDVITPLPLFRIPVTIRRPLIWDGLATIPDIDWMRPPSPKDYKPFTTDEVITGTQYYVTTLGDGSASVFTIDHGLATESLMASLRENHDGGRLLTSPADFTATIDSANSITVTPVGSVLGVAAWALVIASAGPTSVFQAHTHTIAQVLLLQDTLDALGARLTTLEALVLPGVAVADPAAGGTGLTIELGDLKEILFAPAGATAETVVKNTPRMLPAVHIADATTALPIPLPAPVANMVWTAAARTLIPGGGHVRSSYVNAGGFVASDGRSLYPASRSGSSTSYYPAPFERALFELFINDQQFAINRTLDVQFAVEVQLIKATSAAQWMLVIEKGTAPQDTTPSTPGVNLQNLVWDLAAPLVSQRLILTSLKTSHSFGCRILRSASAITADAMKYGVWTPNNAAAPPAANFALRARLINFDTEDSDTTATGWVSYALQGVQGGPTPPQAIIS